MLKNTQNKKKKHRRELALKHRREIALIALAQLKYYKKMKQEPKFKIGQKVYYIQHLYYTGGRSSRTVSSGKITKIYTTDYKNGNQETEYSIGPEDSGYFGTEDKIFVNKKEAEVALQNLVVELEQEKENLSRESKEGKSKKIAELKKELDKVKDAKFVPGPVLKDIEPGATIWLIDLEREFDNIKIEKDKVDYVVREIDKKGVNVNEIGSQLMADGYSIEEINQLPDKNYDELYYIAFGSKELAMTNLNFAKKLVLEDTIKEFESRL